MRKSDDKKQKTKVRKDQKPCKFETLKWTDELHERASEGKTNIAKPGKHDNLLDSKLQLYIYTQKQYAAGSTYFPFFNPQLRIRALESIQFYCPVRSKCNCCSYKTTVLSLAPLLSTDPNRIRGQAKPFLMSKTHKATRLQCAEMSKSLKGRRSDTDWYFPGGYKSHSDIGRGRREAFWMQNPLTQIHFLPLDLFS